MPYLGHRVNTFLIWVFIIVDNQSIAKPLGLFLASLANHNQPLNLTAAQRYNMLPIF